MKTVNLSDVPEHAELYKAKGYVMADSTSTHILYKKKFKLWEWILWTALFFWIGVFAFQTYNVGMIAFIGYPIMCALDTVKVLK